MEMKKYYYNSDIQVGFNIESEWNKIVWTSLNFAKPQELRDEAGIYRVQLLRFDLREGPMPTHFVGSHELFADLTQDTYLSVGKTTNLQRRLLREHFGSDHSGNRLGRHLATLFPTYGVAGKYTPKRKNAREQKYFYIDKNGVQSLIGEGKIRIDFFYEDIWWKRDLFETYGKAHYKCLFDLGVEH